MPRIEVRFQIDANGILSVSAHELRTGVEQAIEVKPSYGLTDEEVERMLIDSFEHAEADFEARLFAKLSLALRCSDNNCRYRQASSQSRHGHSPAMV